MYLLWYVIINSITSYNSSGKPKPSPNCSSEFPIDQTEAVGDPQSAKGNKITSQHSSGLMCAVSSLHSSRGLECTTGIWNKREVRQSDQQPTWWRKRPSQKYFLEAFPRKGRPLCFPLWKLWTICAAKIRIFPRGLARDECVKSSSKGSSVSEFPYITHFTGLCFFPVLITHGTNLTIITVLITSPQAQGF